LGEERPTPHTFLHRPWKRPNPAGLSLIERRFAVQKTGATSPQKITLRRACRLDKHQSVIDEYLRTTPKITATRIGALLRERHDADLQLGERALRQYVAQRRKRLVPKEAFVRAVYQPGDQAQFDFSPMQVIIADVLTVVHVFAMRLSYSGHFFARASYREDRPALFAGLLGAVKFFGGLPLVALFDNAKTAVQRILRGRERERNAEFRAFCGALALEVEFAAPRRGNEKGGVEGLMGYIEDNVFRPIPSYASIEELNAELERLCTANLAREHSTHREPIGERFAREMPALRPLPETLPTPCVREYARVNKFAEVTVETNRYSVPTRSAYRDAMVEIHESRVLVFVDGEQVAEHRRAHGKRQAVINPLHYIDLISRKHRSATRALAFAQEHLPAVLIRLRDRLLDAQGPTATKTWTAILCLALESSLDALSHAVEIALARGTLDPQAIALLLRQRAETPVRLHVTHASPARTAQVLDLAAYRIAALVECAS
jgi:transposase